MKQGNFVCVFFKETNINCCVASFGFLDPRVKIHPFFNVSYVVYSKGQEKQILLVSSSLACCPRFSYCLPQIFDLGGKQRIWSFSAA